VNFKNKDKIFTKLYGSGTPPRECRFAVGDRVRIPLKKSIFDKGYKIAWSEELYTVDRVLKSGSVCYFRLIDADGHSVDKNFYSEELNLVVRNEIPAAN